MTRGDRERSRVGILTSVRLGLVRPVLTEAKSNSETGVVSADGGKKPIKKKEKKPTGELLSGLWQELRLATKPLKEDDLPEAIDLLATLSTNQQGDH